MKLSSIARSIKNRGLMGSFERYREKKAKAREKQMKETQIAALRVRIEELQSQTSEALVGLTEDEQQNRAAAEKLFAAAAELFHDPNWINPTDNYAAIFPLFNDLYDLDMKGLVDHNTEMYQRYLTGVKRVETSNFKKKQRAHFIKELLPAAYAEESQKPIAHKAVLMERGKGISGSLTYMRKYLRKKTDYEVSCRSLNVRAVPDYEFYRNALAYIVDCATAEAIFICTANDFMGYLALRPETTYIQLWHGCGIMKKVGLSTIDKKFGKSAEGHKEYPLNTNYTYVTVASPAQNWIYEESMAIPKDSGILVDTGVSRTDVFFDEKYLAKARKKLEEAIPATKEKKVILYAPTFRGNVAGCVSPDELDIAKMAEAFGDEYVLVLKHHQSVKVTPEIPEPYRDTFAFDMTRGKGMSINELMTVADICISDYSSLVFEYSLFERPIIFFTFDVDEYIDERGLYYKLDEFLPGPMVKTTDEIVDYIQNLDTRFEIERIREFKETYMCACDGHATERIVGLIGTKPKSQQK